MERAVAAALRQRASALVADDVRAGFALLERARAAGLGSLTVLVDARAPDLPVVPKEELLSSAVPAVTREGFGYDPQRGELWFAGETAARRCCSSSRPGAGRSPPSSTTCARERPRPSPAEALGPGRTRPERLEPSSERLRRRRHRHGSRRRSKLRRRRSPDGPGELAAELRRLGAGEAELRRVQSEHSQRATTIDVELARLEAEAAEARRRLEEASAEPAEGPREELETKLVRLERRRETLGGVNPFAKEEYEREKEHLEELRTQRADLERSLAELDKLRRELTETVERRFEETFAAVERNFAEVAATLFPGGEGRLRLTEAEEGDDGEAEQGIEVELRPAGKRITRLSLLSGGEKALGAIAFLFALFLARPCPFYLLDEVEAALDDTNIGRFVELLRRYADRAQFIVVTHQKRTMEAADVLYGVTMAEDGVSQIVSRRLPREDAAALAS